ncbi:MAG TPA: hypothetical protein VL099_06750 [Candidatus Binatia bacterium]|nr:hypothetical protein [Candidatus Binatia bacterium]
MILPAIILVVAVAMLLQFLVFYCRLLVAAGRRVELSESVRKVTGIEGQTVSGEDFPRLRRLVELCPQTDGDGYRLGAIRAYHAFLRVLETLFGMVAPPAAAWATSERSGCAYYAAVTLDARIAQTRRILESDSLTLS